MQPTTSTEIQQPSIQVRGGDGPLVYGALTGAIIVLASVIAILWRRGERRSDRQLKSSEEAREREVSREVTRTKELADAQAARAKEFSDILERQREEFAKIIHDTVTRQAEADRTRDAITSDLIQKLSSVLAALERRVVRRS